MPSALVQSVASKCGYSTERIEKWWEEAKSQVRNEYGRSENDQDFWRLVTGIVKRRAGKECAKKIAKKEDLEFADPNRVPNSRANHVILSHLLSELLSDEYGIQLEK